MQESRKQDPIAVFHRENSSREIRAIDFEILDDSYLLTLPLCAGQATVEVNGKLEVRGNIYPGMMRLTAPGEQIRNIIFSPTEAAVIRIPGNRFRSLMDTISPSHRPGSLAFIDSLLEPDPRVAQLGALITPALQLDPIHGQLFVDGLTQALLACLLSNHNGSRADIYQANLSNLLTKSQIDKCIEFADSSMANGLELESWAAVVGLSGPDFARRFRRTTNDSPYMWFMRRRVDRAKSLLLDPRLSLGEIGSRLGFANQSHFTDAFRRRVGVAPGKWRRHNALKV